MVVRCVLLKKWYGFILSILVIQGQVLIAEDLLDAENKQIVQEVASNFEPKKIGFESFLDEISGNADKRAVDSFDLEELQRELLKILASHYKSLFEKRNAMFEKLSQQDQQRVKTSEQLYQNIVEKIDITSVILNLTESVRDLDSQGIFAFLTDEKHKTLCDLLEKLKTALLNRTFVLLFKGFDDYDGSQPSMMASPEQMINMTMKLGQNTDQVQPLSLTADELERLVNFFDEIETQLGASLPGVMSSLHAFLSAIQKKQSNQVTALVLTSIKEDFNETFAYIKESVTLFEIALNQEQDPSSKEAYEFWLKTLRRLHRSLWVFDSLRASASFDTTKLSHNLFTLVTYGYDIAQGFFDLYKIDNNVGRFSGPVAADWAFCASLATWHFFNMRSDFYNGLLLTTILGDLKIDTFEARQLLMYNAMLLPTTMFTLFDPSFWNKKPYGLAKALHKVATAWIYYLVVDGNLFGDGEMHWWIAGQGGPTDAQGNADPNGQFHRDPQYIDAQYRRKDRHLRRALLYAVDEGTHYLSRILQQRIVYNTNPMTLEKARTYSMGIIRPAMVGYVLKALVPFVFLQDSHLGNPPIPKLGTIVSFDRNDLFSFDNRDYFGQNFMTRTQGYQGFAKDTHFIESVLASYIGESVGGFWGRKLVQGYKSQIYSASEHALGALGSVLETAGLMSHDQIQAIKEFKNDVASEFEYDLVALKFLLRGVFEANSSFRNVIIPLLVNRGYLDENETNPIEVNRVIVYFVVDFLAQWKLMTYYDAAKVAHKFDADPQATEKVIDGIVTAVLGNLAGAAGEYAGSLVGHYGAKWLMSKTGPIYAQLRPAQAQA